MDRGRGAWPARAAGGDAQALARREEYQKQDEALDALSESASRLGELSLLISHELEAQGQVIEETEAAVTATDARVGEATRQVREIVRQVRACDPLWTAVVVLSAVALALGLYILFII